MHIIKSFSDCLVGTKVLLLSFLENRKDNIVHYTVSKEAGFTVHDITHSY